MKTNGLTRDEAKELVLKIINGGGNEANRQLNDSFSFAIRKEVNEIRKYIVRNHPKLYKKIKTYNKQKFDKQMERWKKRFGNKRPRMKRADVSRMSHFMFNIGNKMLQEMCQGLQKKLL